MATSREGVDLTVYFNGSTIPFMGVNFERSGTVLTIHKYTNKQLLAQFVGDFGYEITK